MCQLQRENLGHDQFSFKLCPSNAKLLLQLVFFFNIPLSAERIEASTATDHAGLIA